MKYSKGTLLAVELVTGEKLIGQIVEPQKNVLPSFLDLSDGIFLKRERHVSFLSNDSIKNIRPARSGEKEIDR